MNKKRINSAYFIGIGGIGMSALALFFKSNGIDVFGYDKVETAITKNLVDRGIDIVFIDDEQEINPAFYAYALEECRVIYTPAIPDDHSILNYFRNNNYKVLKRADALAEVLKDYKTIAVAGTHGKTTTSAILAHILHHSELGCNAFLGGISTDFKSNLILNNESEFAVVEADEYDRSFLKLQPFVSIVTTLDPDHLDIYQSEEDFRNSFIEFISSTTGGFNVLNQSINYVSDLRCHLYGATADNRVERYRINNGHVQFDLKINDKLIKNINFALPGVFNAENALAASIVAYHLGIKVSDIEKALGSFQGVKRRFEYHIRNDQLIFIDDYAHHPGELNATIGSLKELYPDQMILGVFQPHLFSRTRDFMEGFARALEALDKIVLLDIYPAREEPISGVTSAELLAKINSSDKYLVGKDDLISFLEQENFDVLITLGAGDIDQLVDPIKNAMQSKLNFETEKG